MEKNKQSISGHKRFQLVKRQYKRLLLIGMLIISLSLSGCKKTVETDAGAETKGITQAVGEAADNESVTLIKTVEPPKDGWTLEQLNEVIYINDIKYNYPISLKDLGENFDADKKLENLILYNNQNAFGGHVNENKVYDSLMFSISGNQSSIPDNKLININGVTLGTELQNLFLKIGKTEIETKNELTRVIYNVENLTLIFILDKEMKVNIITLLWE